jgi:hypothetical protein
MAKKENSRERKEGKYTEYIFKRVPFFERVRSGQRVGNFVKYWGA